MLTTPPLPFHGWLQVTDSGSRRKDFETKSLAESCAPRNPLVGPCASSADGWRGANSPSEKAMEFYRTAPLGTSQYYTRWNMALDHAIANGSSTTASKANAVNYSSSSKSLMSAQRGLTGACFTLAFKVDTFSQDVSFKACDSAEIAQGASPSGFSLLGLPGGVTGMKSSKAAAIDCGCLLIGIRPGVKLGAVALSFCL